MMGEGCSLAPLGCKDPLPLSLCGTSVGTIKCVWAAFLGKCFPMGSCRGALKKVSPLPFVPGSSAQDPSPSGIPSCHLTSILPTAVSANLSLLNSVEVENGWLSSSLHWPFGDSGTQF